MKLLLTLILASTFAVSAMAENISYELPVTRNGKTEVRLAYNFWSGEYPGPVIRINAKKPGKTTVKAYKSPRALKNRVACTVQNGMYHPWGQTENSIINYYTLAALNKYKAKTDTVIDWAYDQSNPLLIKGETFNVVYAAEGMCLADIDVQTIDFSCDAPDNDSNLVKVSPEDEFYEQWLYVTCAEGYNAFLEVGDILTQKGVSEGTITEYGSVN